VQGPLYDYLKSLGVTQPIDPELAADIDALVLARVKAEITSRAAHAPIKPPLPELTPMQIQAVIRRGKERPWSGRAAYHSDPFRWVADNYGEWIPGRKLLSLPHFSPPPFSLLRLRFRGRQRHV
jgi:hypothetical protein